MAYSLFTIMKLETTSIILFNFCINDFLCHMHRIVPGIYKWKAMYNKSLNSEYIQLYKFAMF